MPGARRRPTACRATLRPARPAASSRPDRRAVSGGAAAAGQAGDEHLDHELGRARPCAPAQVEVGLRPAGRSTCGEPVVAEPAGLVERLLGRERASPSCRAASAAALLAADRRRRRGAASARSGCAAWPCTWSGWRSPPPEHAVQHARGPRRTSPRSMASVRSHGGTSPASPRYGSTSSRADPGAGAEGALEGGEQAGQAAGLARRGGRRPACGPRRRASAPAPPRCSSIQPACGLAGAGRGVDHHAAGGVDRVGEALRHVRQLGWRCGRGSFSHTSTSDVVGQRVGEVGDERGDRVLGARTRRRGGPTTTRRSVRNGGVWAASTSGADVVAVVVGRRGGSRP